jgi:cobalt-zinc-cadmium resistance protein CzcA
MLLHKLIELSTQYKLLVIALFLTLSLFGFKAYQEVPIDAFPDITPKQVVIYTESPGNSAEDIEKLITYPIESSMAGMAGVEKIMSNSFFGLSYVAIFFDDSMDIYFLRQLVSERLTSVDIPKGWGKPELGPNTTGLGQVFWYKIEDSTNHYSLQELRQMQEYIVAPLLKSITGVEEVVGWGGEQKQYTVLVDTHKLQNYQLTFSDVITAIQASNQAAGGQYLEFNHEQYLIRGAGLYQSLDDIRNTLITSIQGNAITIRDIATVEIGSVPRFGAVSIDGSEAVMGMVLQRTQTNAADVVKRIRTKLETINTTLPQGVVLTTLYDRTQITHKAVATITTALLSGVALVIVILFLFLFELRSAFIVVLSLPLSLLIAFLLMKTYGLSANLMSLSGLAIAVGMIVDATIVMVENSFRKLHDNPKLSRLETIVASAKEVAKPITFAILIISAVFIPLLSLDGLAGKLYTPMAINIVFVMLGSLAVALILVPVLSIWLLKPVKNSNNPLMTWIKKRYTPLLELSLNHAKKTLLIISTIFIGALILLFNQGREFMPDLNEESIMYRVIAIPGTGLTQTVDTAQAIEKHILQYYPQHVTSVLSMMGRSEKGETAQANYMEVLLTLHPDVQNIDTLATQLNHDLAKTFAHVQFVPTQPIAMRIEELLEGVQAELAIKIYGEDQKVLASIADAIKQQLAPINGLDHMEVETQLGQAKINITPNYLALARYGIQVEEVMDIIRYGVGEQGVSEMITGVQRFPIVAKVNNAKHDITSLKNITLRSKNGALVTLEQLCHIDVIQGASFIKRENLHRYMVLSMEITNRDVASFVTQATKQIKANVIMPTGYFIDWAGDFKRMEEATNKLLLIIPVTLALILLLLYTAFNSFKKSLLILVNVPFGLIGAIIALLITDIYLSISAIVGFIAVFAIAILNGIVLVSFIDELRNKFPDVKLKLIVKDALLLRIRPVLMTAFTTLFGILPLLFVSGVGSEIQYPLSVVVTGGIISSTLLTLLILPSAYILFFDKKS